MIHRRAECAIALAAWSASLIGCGGGGTGPGLTNPGHSGGGGAGDAGTLSGAWNHCAIFGTGGPENVALSADGATVAFLFRQGQVAIYRAADGALLREIPGTLAPFPADLDTLTPPQGGEIDYNLRHHAIALSPDGAMVAVEDQSHTAIWSVSDGTQLLDFASSGTVFGDAGLAFSPAGDAFLANGRELRRISDGTIIHDYAGLGSQAAITFAANGTQVVGYAGGAIVTAQADQIGRVLGSTPLADTPAFEDVPTFSPAGRYLAGPVTIVPPQSCAACLGVRVYDAVTGQRLPTSTSFWTAAHLVFSPDEGKLFGFDFASNFASTTVIDLASGQVQTTQTMVYAAALGSAGSPLFTIQPAGAFATSDPGALAASTRFLTLPGQGLSSWTMAASPDGHWLATSAMAGPDNPPMNDVTLWSVDERRAIRSIPWTAEAGVHTLRFSADSQRLLLIGGAVQEWTVNADQPSWTYTPQDGVTPRNGAYSPSSSEIAVTLPQGISFMTAGASVIPNVTIDVGWSSIDVGFSSPGLAFSPRDGGATVVTSGPALWRLADRQMLWPASAPSAFEVPHDDWLVYSPDGSAILLSSVITFGEAPFNATTGGQAGNGFTSTTSLYRSDGGSLLETFGNSLVAVLPRQPAFSPDGAWIIAGNLVWNVQSGQPGQLLALSPRYKTASVSTFLPDGRIAVARDDGVIELFCPQ